MIANANALRIPLADRSVHMIATSPPYFGLRDYNVAGQIGLEVTPAEYVEALRQFGREAWRVLRDDGTLWLNLGDSFANDSKWGGTTGGEHAARLHGNTGIGRGKTETGLRSKSLIGIPWRVAFALQDDGWILRSEIIWEKPNAKPESVTDRPTKAHEHIFLLAKQPKYFYDNEAVKEDSTGSTTGAAASFKRDGSKRGESICPASPMPTHRDDRELIPYDGPTRNRRTVWSVATTPFSGAHFACWPPALVEPMIKAGTSERGVCPVCAAPWVRVVEKVKEQSATHKGSRFSGRKAKIAAEQTGAPVGKLPRTAAIITTGWRPTCKHEAEPIPAIVLDPFCGSGTTGLVACELGRRFIGLDLNARYLGLIAMPRAERKQVAAALDDLPLFATASGA